MIVGLRASRIFHALSQHPDICEDFIRGFWSTADIVTENYIEGIAGTVAGTCIVITEEFIRTCLNFGDNPEHPTSFTADQMTDMYLAHVVNQCISGRKGGYDELSVNMTSMVYALVMGENFNFSRVVFEELKSNLIRKKKSVFLMYPRFLQMIINREHPELALTQRRLHVKAEVLIDNEPVIPNVLLAEEHEDEFIYNIEGPVYVKNEENVENLKDMADINLDDLIFSDTETQGTCDENFEKEDSESEGDSEGAAGKPSLINPSKPQSDTSDEDYDFEADLGLRKKINVSEQLLQKSIPMITPIVTRQQDKGKEKVVDQPAPMDVQALQQRVFTLEQDSVAKDSKIENLHAENDALRKTINIQSGYINSLKDNMVFVLEELKRLKGMKDKKKIKDGCSGNDVGKV
ncbi:hypothetical protein L1987_43175 [Smallanthus sonchifolius]|uniref:Uncharacterized protein n=1 Tax=Smallanthus sonchifolius TaxID=185202 RepID=A0ACB9GLY8_9ASTR|nr:hypothetical protein L1987_43175 [Smallanthus sonchifolius]